MSSKQLHYAQYDDDAAFYVKNNADYVGDEIDEHPAIRSFQLASRQAILRAVQNPSNKVIKVAVLAHYKKEIRGYVTLSRFLYGASPQHFEKMLGFRDGALKPGCRLYLVNASALTADNIGPRYFSSWSAGVSARDLQRLSEQHKIRIDYHSDYPPASDPIPQFVIFRPVPALRSIVLHYDDRFDGI